MPKAYRRASSHNCLWVFIILAGIALGIAVAANMDDKRYGAWVALPGIGIPIVATILALILMARLTRARHGRIKAVLEELGYSVKLKPTPEAKEQFYAPIFHLTTWAGLQGGATQIEWCADAGDESKAFEHSFVTGSGKHTQEHIHTIVGIPYREADAGGGLLVTRPHFGSRRFLESRTPSVPLGDERFDKAWVVQGDPELARAILNEQVRHQLSDSPKGEAWQLGEGWACCTFKGPLDGEDMRAFVREAREVVEALNCVSRS